MAALSLSLSLSPWGFAMQADVPPEEVVARLRAAALDYLLHKERLQQADAEALAQLAAIDYWQQFLRGGKPPPSSPVAMIVHLAWQQVVKHRARLGRRYGRGKLCVSFQDPDQLAGVAPPGLPFEPTRRGIMDWLRSVRPRLVPREISAVIARATKRGTLADVAKEEGMSSQDLGKLISRAEQKIGEWLDERDS